MRRRGSGIKVAVFPWDPNPYQRNLYSAMLARHDATLYRGRLVRWLGPLPFMLVLPILRVVGYTNLHLHWQPFYVKQPRRFRLPLSYLVARMAYAEIAVLRFHVVVTVHNVDPHDRLTTDDNRIATIQTTTADTVVVHTARTAERLRTTRGVPDSKIVVIPHGPYHPVNSPAHERPVRSGGAEPTRLLFFGAIRRYKGVSSLTTALREVATDAPLELRVYGHTPDDADWDDLCQALGTVPSNVGTLARRGFLSESDLEDVIDASDLVCLPFQSVTTSGSAIMAMSRMRPIVAPRVGDLIELPDDCGYFYDAASGLAASLDRAVAEGPDRRAERGRRGFEWVTKAGWDDIAARTFGLYA